MAEYVSQTYISPRRIWQGTAQCRPIYQAWLSETMRRQEPWIIIIATTSRQTSARPVLTERIPGDRRLARRRLEPEPEAGEA